LAAPLRILYVCNPGDSLESLPAGLRETADIITVHNPLRALAKVAREQFDGVYVAADHLQAAVRLGRLLENDRILEGMPDAVALVDPELTILWANHQFLRWCNRGNVVGDQFYLALGNPEIVSTEAYPLREVLKRAVRGPPSGYHASRRDARNAAASQAGRHSRRRPRTGRPEAGRNLQNAAR